MPAPTSALPTLGSPNSTEDPKTRAALAELQTILTAGVDTSNLAASLTSTLGLTSSGRGKTNIATTETRTNVAYGLLTTPDKVTVTLPTDALIAVAFQAVWQNSNAGTGNAAIFIGVNQLEQASGTFGGPTNQQANGSNTVATDHPLVTSPGGLTTVAGGGAIAPYTGDVTTGQLVGDLTAPNVGGPCYIFAAAGTYDVSVQFKASAGSVTVKNRRLWVWTVAF